MDSPALGAPRARGADGSASGRRRWRRGGGSAGAGKVYNNADQLLEENGVTYTYDLNGNLKTKTDGAGTTTYTWDYEDRLVKVNGPGGTVTYEYDVDGNRVSSTTSARTTRYLVDTNRALPQVLAEYTPDGTVLASYVYADDLISMTRANQTRWYHFDGLGSTRLLTDESGVVTDTYSYDAFGNLIALTGTTQNDFLFTGQQRDANAGFYYLRARYYNPSAGVFASVDPFAGDLYAPASLHKYQYVMNDPANRRDPSGLFSLTELSVSSAVSSVLRTINYAKTAVSLLRTRENVSLALVAMTVLYQYTFPKRTNAGVVYDFPLAKIDSKWPDLGVEFRYSNSQSPSEIGFNLVVIRFNFRGEQHVRDGGVGSGRISIDLNRGDVSGGFGLEMPIFRTKWVSMAVELMPQYWLGSKAKISMQMVFGASPLTFRTFGPRFRTAPLIIPDDIKQYM